MDNGNLTVGKLRKILRVAGDDATIDQALEQLAEADRREADDLEHGEHVAAYEDYLASRAEAEREYIQDSYDETKKATLEKTGGEIDRERLHAICIEEADRARLYLEVHEGDPMTFEEWQAAGQPDAPTIDSLRDQRAKLTGAVSG